MSTYNQKMEAVVKAVDAIVTGETVDELPIICREIRKGLGVKHCSRKNLNDFVTMQQKLTIPMIRESENEDSILSSLRPRRDTRGTDKKFAIGLSDCEELLEPAMA